MSFSLLWNVESLEVIQKLGLSQGDPISPYLFVLCMERLAHRIQKQVEDGHWKALKASQYGLTISYLFFADDLLLLADSSCSQIRVIKSCLDDISMASGPKINLEKSKKILSKI